MASDHVFDQAVLWGGGQSCPINGLRFAPEWAGTSIHLLSLPVADYSNELFAEELPAIATAADIRRATFSSGRHCARALLLEAGLPVTALPRRDNGSVQWPDGVIGSLSHTQHWAVAAVAARNMCEAQQLGIDLERIQAMDEAVIKLIATPVEREALSASSSPLWLPTALFSLKESIYKCLANDFGHFFGFQDVQLSALQSGRPEVEFLRPELRARYVGEQLELRIAITPWHVFSLAWLRVV